MRRRLAIAVICCIAIACNEEKRRLTERLHVLEQDHVAASRRLSACVASVAASEERLRAVKVDLARERSDIERYLEAHKIASACIQAGRMNWGDRPERGRRLPKCAQIGTVLCNVALLSPIFANEVAGVAHRMADSDARQRDLNQQIGAAEKTIERQRIDVHAAEDEIDRIDTDVAGLRHQLDVQ